MLGLVRHLAAVEHSWFRRVMAGEDVPPIYPTEASRDLDFDGAIADLAVVDDAWRNRRREVAFAEEYVVAADARLPGPAPTLTG